ncbi:polyamine aminopropyltransferase [Petrotoga halophila]|uniref:Polyamine aminopropyltransferase n=1 Tax=Petrotoga halophila DSM 16923 TaxID=1122953 RepID=A0A2S5EGA2_9BACT|nr:polyamine aminopropyltransferase [Petrotoga halophila]POZ92161.1 spermidine synthase [Petrotoga halophila DSM 16923]
MAENNYTFPHTIFTEYDKAHNVGVFTETTNHIYTEQTEYQRIDIYETPAFGKLFSLDGVIMTRDSDEFVYHEMISHVPLFIHPNPKKVLIIGGGDGGTVREVLKHDSVEKVVLCELDKKVIEAALKYLPNISYELKNPKVELVYEDGSKFVSQFKDEFDVILIDSTDPTEGEGGLLFTEKFYQNCFEALNENGVFSAQTEEPFLKKEWMVRAYRRISNTFNIARLYMGYVPQYMPGTWTWTFASKNLDPIKDFDPEKVKEFNKELKYYDEEVHVASFSLPVFVKKLISEFSK